MKTTIFDELEIPEEHREALSREALRQGVTLGQLVARCLLKKADQIIAASRRPLHPTPHHRAA